jgi:hypothetical protein
MDKKTMARKVVRALAKLEAAKRPLDEVSSAAGVPPNPDLDRVLAEVKELKKVLKRKK